MNDIWTYIKAEKFFPKYCPEIKSHRHKIRGKNGRGNPVEFTEVEKREIKKGLKKMAAEIQKAAF